MHTRAYSIKTLKMREIRGSRQAAALAVVVACGASLAAHHGNSVAYDPNKSVTLTGTVNTFVWTNPHGQIRFDVKDRNGNVVTWGGELPSIGLMTKAGWSKNILKPGEEVVVTGHPSKFGTPNIVVELITVGGKEYFRTVPTNESPERVLQFFDAGAGN
jgi:hypothetical protein